MDCCYRNPTGLYCVAKDTVMGKNSNDHPSVLIAEDDLIYQRLLEKYIEQAGGPV